VLLVLVEALLLAYDLQRAYQLTRERKASIATLQADIERLETQGAERREHYQEIIDAWAKEEHERQRYLPGYRGAVKIPFEVHMYASGGDCAYAIRRKQEGIKSIQDYLQADLRKTWSVTMRLYYLAGNGPDNKPPVK
jgi:hypothetical protein